MGNKSHSELTVYDGNDTIFIIFQFQFRLNIEIIGQTVPQEEPTFKRWWCWRCSHSNRNNILQLIAFKMKMESLKCVDSLKIISSISNETTTYREADWLLASSIVTPLRGMKIQTYSYHALNPQHSNLKWLGVFIKICFCRDLSTQIDETLLTFHFEYCSVPIMLTVLACCRLRFTRTSNRKSGMQILLQFLSSLKNREL